MKISDDHENHLIKTHIRQAIRFMHKPALEQEGGLPIAKPGGVCYDNQNITGNGAARGRLPAVERGGYGYGICR